MPLYKEWSPNEHSLAAIWQVEEEEAFFGDASIIPTYISHPKRRIEHLAGRYLLTHLKEDFPLHHIAADEHDKPRLPDNQYFFSISHSFPYITAIISDTQECGIDIQTWHPRIAALQHMYLAEREQALCEGDATLMTVAWCAKEAAYKWNGRRGIDFIQHMPIQFLQKNENDLTLEITLFYQEQKWILYPQCFVHKDFAMSTVVKERQ